MARDFSGTAQYLRVDATPVTAAPLTMACWVYWDSLPTRSQAFVVSASGSASNQFSLGNNSFNAELRISAGGSNTNVTGTTTLVTGRWYHVCGVFRSSTDRELYINGVSDATNTTSRTPASIGAITIGANGAGSNETDGKIAEVGLWNVSLSTTEIASLAAGYSPRFIRPDKLLCYWPILGWNSPEPCWNNPTYNLTVTGATQYQHPRIINPWQKGGRSTAATVSPALEFEQLPSGLLVPRPSVTYSFPDPPPAPTDEYGPALKNFPLEIHEDYDRSVQAQPWLPLPFLYDEFREFVSHLLNMTGWETGDNYEVQSATGSYSVQSAIVRTGNYALRTNPITTATGYQQFGGLRTDGSDSFASVDAGFSRRQVFARLYIYIVTLPAAAEEVFCRWIVSGPTASSYFTITSGGIIKFYNASGTLVETGTTALATGQWYRLEMMMTAGTSQAYELRLALGDGPAAVELTGTSTQGGTTMAHLILGKYGNLNGQTVDYVFDDLVVRDDTYPAVGGIHLAKITDAADILGWTPNTGTEVSAVSEVPPDGDTSYIESSTAGDYISYTTLNLTSAGISYTDQIRGSKAIQIVRGTGASSRALGLTVSSDGNGSPRSTGNLNPGTSYRSQCLSLDLAPGSGSAWTYTDLTNVVITPENNASQGVRVTSLYLMVDSYGFGLDHQDDWLRDRQDLPWLPKDFGYDELGANLTTFGVDQQDWRLPEVQTIVWPREVSLDDETAAGATGFGLDTERLPESLQAMDLTWVRVAARDDEQGFPLLNFALEQEEPWRGEVQDIAWLPRAWVDEDPKGNLLNFGIDQQEPWLAEVQLLAWDPLPFRDDEIGSSLRNFFLEQEEPWLAAYQLVYDNLPAERSDEIGSSLLNFPLLEETSYLTDRQELTWGPGAARDDEAGGLFRTLPLEDERAWEAACQLLPWLPAPALDDEITGDPRNFWLEQEEPWLAAALDLPWLAVSFTEDSGSVRSFVVEQEDGTIGLVQLQLVPWLPLSFRDEEASGNAVNFGVLDDDAWEARQQVQVWEPLADRRDDETTGTFAGFGLVDGVLPPLEQLQLGWLPPERGPRLDDELGAALPYEAWDDESVWELQFARQEVCWLARPGLDDETAGNLVILIPTPLEDVYALVIDVTGTGEAEGTATGGYGRVVSISGQAGG